MRRRGSNNNSSTVITNNFEAPLQPVTHTKNSTTPAPLWSHSCTVTLQNKSSRQRFGIRAIISIYPDDGSYAKTLVRFILKSYCAAVKP